MIWTYDRADRLESLIGLADAQVGRLRRAMIDAPRGSQARGSLRRRLGLAESRARRLRETARNARRRARELAAA